MRYETLTSTIYIARKYFINLEYFRASRMIMLTIREQSDYFNIFIRISLEIKTIFLQFYQTGTPLCNQLIFRIEQTDFN